MVIIYFGGCITMGFTPSQRRVLELRRQFSQSDVASMLGISQAGVSRIENLARKKVLNSIATIIEAEKLGVLFKIKISDNIFENCLTILRFTSIDYALTGVAGQWLLVGYYKLDDEIEIRTNSKELSFLNGVKVVGTLDAFEKKLWIKSIAVALPERIVADCILRKDSAGFKSAIATLLWEKCDIQKIKKLLVKHDLKNILLQLLSAINMTCKDYSLKNPYSGFKLVKPSKKIYEITLKVVDDLAPFLFE